MDDRSTVENAACLLGRRTRGLVCFVWLVTAYRRRGVSRAVSLCAGAGARAQRSAATTALAVAATPRAPARRVVAARPHPPHPAAAAAMRSLLTVAAAAACPTPPRLARAPLWRRLEAVDLDRLLLHDALLRATDSQRESDAAKATTQATRQPRAREATHRDEERADVLALVALQLNHMPLAAAKAQRASATAGPRASAFTCRAQRAAASSKRLHTCSGSSTTVPLQQNSFLKALSTFL